MKQLFYLSLAFLAITGCRKIETDGEKEIFVVTKEVNPPPTPGVVSNTITLKGRITKDTILYAKDENFLSGLVYITNGATLTIEEGAKVQGKFSGADVGALIITRGSKIHAIGSVEKPIIFTSSATTPQSGDWGGIILCGKAPINTSYSSIKGLYQVEGGVDNANGDGLAGSGDAGNVEDADDNSGVMSYVRIQYAGYAFQPDKEINSLTMAAVGRGTTIDHIQVTYAKDDAFEWFGGTVNCKYLIAFKTQDDDFDTDNGFTGRVQFGIAMRDPNIADISSSEAFESDNDAAGDIETPITAPVFSNFTVVGPKPTSTSPFSSLFKAGAHIRRNTKISIFNTLFIGWPTGIYYDNNGSAPVTANLSDDTTNNSTGSVFRNNTLAGNYDKNGVISSVTQSSANPSFGVLNWVKGNKGPDSTNIEISTTDAKLMRPFDFIAPDFTPFGNASASTASPRTLVTWGTKLNVNYAPYSLESWPGNGSFSHILLADAFFTPVTFRGAVNPAGDSNQNWWKGWTIWK